MTYNLIVTEHADELLDHILHHLFYHLKSRQAVQHLLNEIDNIYYRLEDNPFQFPLSKDICLAKKGYREAIIPQMNYIIIYGIQADTVYIAGIFHQLENYQKKI